MGGKEYEVIAEGNEDPASCLVYVPLHEKDIADPLTIRMWKAEAKLARGDIMINGGGQLDSTPHNTFYPPVSDPLEQIAELKKRIHAIEKRRVILLKAKDPAGQILLQDNMVRPNKPFDIWALAPGKPEHREPIQYIRPRALVLTISSNDTPEHFLFNIANQIPPCCRASGDTLSADGRIKLNLTSELKTIQGSRTEILNRTSGGRIELEIELKMRCKYESGLATLNAQILNCSYIREVQAPSIRIGKLTFPEIGDHLIALLGISVDIYTADAKFLKPNFHSPILNSL